MLQCCVRLSVVCNVCIVEKVRLSEKLFEEANRKWPMGNRIVTCLMTSCDPERLRAQYLENSRRCYLVTIANY